MELLGNHTAQLPLGSNLGFGKNNPDCSLVLVQWTDCLPSSSDVTVHGNSLTCTLWTWRKRRSRLLSKCHRGCFRSIQVRTETVWYSVPVSMQSLAENQCCFQKVLASMMAASCCHCCLWFSWRGYQDGDMTGRVSSMRDSSEISAILNSIVLLNSNRISRIFYSRGREPWSWNAGIQPVFLPTRTLMIHTWFWGR